MSIGSMLLNLHPEPYPGYKFTVYMQNIRMGFSKVTNIEDSIQTEPLQEGGVNDRVYSLRKPITAERTMVFERGVAGRGLLMTLLTLRITVGQRLSSDIIIIVKGRNGSISRIFLVHGAVIKKWSYSDLDAMSGDLFIERIEVAYETFETCPIISGMADALGNLL